MIAEKKPTNLTDRFAPYPRSEEEATAQNVYRHLLVAAQITWLSRVRPFTKRGGPTDTQQHMAAIECFLAEWSTLHLLRHMLGFKYPDGFPQATTPDEVARDMWIGWEDGGGPAEALYEWLEEAGFDPEAIEKAYDEAMASLAAADGGEYTP